MVCPGHDPSNMISGLIRLGKRGLLILGDIRFEHSVFVLPFALISTFIAADGRPPWDKLGWIVVAMVGARNIAMAFNRIVDAEYDRLNPRTCLWALPTGRLEKRHYMGFIALSVLLFLVACYQLNDMALRLSPLALFIITFYSLTKRFTWFSHLFLGLAEGIVPIAAWIAIRAEVSLTAVILGVAVTLWLAGFDIIYACQDVAFDATQRLHSLPQRFGLTVALRVSFILHLAMVALLGLVLLVAPLGYFYLIGVVLVLCLLTYEHALVKPHDLSRVNRAFFTVNGWISLVLMGFTILDSMLGKGSRPFS